MKKQIPINSQIWMSHSDTVTELPEGCEVVGRNLDGVPVALRWNDTFFGIQFHPEVSHTNEGTQIRRNSLRRASNLPEIAISLFKDELVERVPADVGGQKVVCGVSGGVDSSVLVALLHDAEEVASRLGEAGIEIEMIDASKLFPDALGGVMDPEKRRLIIGRLFV